MKIGNIPQLECMLIHCNGLGREGGVGDAAGEEDRHLEAVMKMKCDVDSLLKGERQSAIAEQPLPEADDDRGERI